MQQQLLNLLCQFVGENVKVCSQLKCFIFLMLSPSSLSSSQEAISVMSFFGQKFLLFCPIVLYYHVCYWNDWEYS